MRLGLYIAEKGRPLSDVKTDIDIKVKIQNLITGGVKKLPGDIAVVCEFC
jgi:hypothetical protein